MGGMRIELLVVPGCAGEATAVALLTTALDDIGLGSVGFAVTIIESQQEADGRHFIGSPTFYIDGEDVFPEPGRPASIGQAGVEAGGRRVGIPMTEIDGDTAIREGLAAWTRGDLVGR